MSVIRGIRNGLAVSLPIWAAVIWFLWRIHG
jgi:hypothetical protein